MRNLLLLLASLFFLSAKAQTYLPGAGVSFMQPLPLPGNHGADNPQNKKWYFSKYAGVSAGFGYFYGGVGSYIAVPVGVQLNHPLNNNLTAFAGISAAPTFFSFNSAFVNPTATKYYPGSYLPNTYNFGMSSRVEMGLMYTNDEKTFSISGSIGVERSSYPIFPVQQGPTRKNAK
jgi:hypothetical protein